MDSELWYKSRHYLHFDKPLGVKKATKIVTSPDTVASHSFYPFLTYDIHASKIYKDNSKTIQKKGKVRPIAFAAHSDSQIYSYYCQLLTQPYEKKLKSLDLSKNVLAFRKLGKSNIDFAHDAFMFIKEFGECTVIGYDISGFFNNLDHNLLKESWCKLLEVERLTKDHFAVFKSLTSFSQVNRAKLFKTLGLSIHNLPKNIDRICSPLDFRNKVRNGGLVEKNPNRNKDGQAVGIPQGSPISAFLSNLYMLNFDNLVAKIIEEQGGMYYRYCDDMLFIVPTKWRSEITNLVRSEIKKLNIDINIKKIEEREFKLKKDRLYSDKPLQYLGFLFDGSNIILRSASLARYSERVRRGVILAKKTRLKHNRSRILKGQRPTALHKKKLYENYSHLGKRNFVRYGLRAADKMKSKSIKKQLKPLWKRLQNQIK